MPYILIQVNEGIVKLITLMVKGNEIITKVKVMQLHFKILLKQTLYHQCGQYCNTLIYIYPQFSNNLKYLLRY
jgi:hypothetical protein